MLIILLYIIIYLIPNLGIFGLAFFVYLRHRTKEYNSFVLFCVGLGIWLLLQFIAQAITGTWPAVAQVLINCTLAVSNYLSVAFFFYCAYYVRKNPRVVIHVVVPTILALACLVPGLFITKAEIDWTGIGIDATPLYYAPLLLNAVYATWACRLLIADLRTAKFAIRKTRTRLILYGFLQTAVILIIGIGVFQKVLILQLITPLSILIMVSIFTYGTVRYRLFDLRLLVIRSLAYIFALAVLALLYSFLVTSVISLFISISNSSAIVEQQADLLAAIVLAMSFGTLKRLFDRVSQQIFYRDVYDIKTVIDSINYIIVRSTDVHKLATRCLEVVRNALKAEFITIIILNQEGSQTIRTITIGKSSDSSDATVAPLKSMRRRVIFRDETELEPNLEKLFHGTNVAAIAQLNASGSLIGYLLFGDKSTGSSYNASDADLIRIFTDVASVALQNTLSFEKIERFNETLQEEVLNATEQLRATNKKLRALDKAKDEFISIASHQLRTPLTSVKGHLSMLLDGDAGKLNTHQYQLAKDTYTSADRMAFLITDLLNVSRLKDGKLTIVFDPVNLPQLIRNEVEQLTVAAQSRNLTIEAHLPKQFPLVLLDISKIRQVIMNFLDNAIFYSRVGGVITITLQQHNHQIELTVQDTGIGVPVDEQPHIFSKFFRASNARYARPDGTGIGLFAASKIVAAHNGTMIFESKENKGSTFGFYIPLHLASDLEKTTGDLEDNPA